MNHDNFDWPKVGINTKLRCFLQLAPTSLQDGVLSEKGNSRSSLNVFCGMPSLMSSQTQMSDDLCGESECKIASW